MGRSEVAEKGVDKIVPVLFKLSVFNNIFKNAKSDAGFYFFGSKLDPASY